MWSVKYLFPTILAMAFIFIAPQLWLQLVGIALAALLLARAVVLVRTPVTESETVERPLDEVAV